MSTDSDDSLSSDAIQLPLPPLPGQGNQVQRAASKVPAEFDFGSSSKTFESSSYHAQRRTPSPPLPSLTSQDQTLSDTWHDDSTPTASRSRPDPNFYTTQWGSPYDLPRPKRTRFANHRGTLSLEGSPLKPLARRSSSPVEIDDEADPRFDLTLSRADVQTGTGRFRGKRTQDWLKAHVAFKRRGEKKNWWSDEESDPDAEQASRTATGAKKRRGRKSEFDDTWLALRDEGRSRSISQGAERSRSVLGSLRRQHRRILSSRIHRAAPSDATLTQAQWDELVAEEEQHDDLPDINMLQALSQGMQGMQGMIARRGSSRNTSKDLSNMEKPLPPAPLDRTVSESPVGATRSSPEKMKRPSLSTTPSTRTNKKKVQWRGKTCVIALPAHDGKDENGNQKTYLTPAQVSERMKRWEEKGYSSRGFDLADSHDTYGAIRGQSRDMYPSPNDWQQEARRRDFRVKVPNRQAWEDYVRELQEEKLRKLGVLKDRPAEESPSLSQAQISRTGSSQAISRAPTAMSNTIGSSVNGFRGPFGETAFSPASFTSPDGVQSRNSMISPVNQPTAGFHAPKQSIAFLPGQGFVNIGFPLPQPTPPPPQPALTGQNLMASQNLMAAQQASRGPSPALIDLHNRRMSILTTPIMMAQNTESAQLRQQQQQLQQALMQGRQLTSQPPNNRPDDMNGPAIYSQPSHIASPMPQGNRHRHNVSASLQKDIDDAEYHLEESIRKQLEDTEEPSNLKDDKKDGNKTPEVAEDENISSKVEPKAERIEADLNTSTSSINFSTSSNMSRTESKQGHARKASTSKLRPTASEFKFDPTKSFQPTGSFGFGQFESPQRTKPAFQPTEQQAQPPAFQFGKKPTPGHSKTSSIASNLNVTAKEFVPGQAKSFIPQTDFNFSLSNTQSDSHPFTPRRSAANSISSVTPSDSASAERPGRIFGNFNFSEMVKPERKNKAVPIVKPQKPPRETDNQTSETPGGTERLENKREKRSSNKADDDEIPQFEVPLVVDNAKEQFRIAAEQVKAATPQPPPVLRSMHTPPPDEQQEQGTEIVKAEGTTQDLQPPPPSETVTASVPEASLADATKKAENELAESSELQQADKHVSNSGSNAEKINSDMITTAAEQGKTPLPTYELKMPKVDTDLSAKVAEEQVDWAETPLEGPFSRANLDKAFAEKPRHDSIAEDPVAEAKAEDLIRKPSSGNTALPIVNPASVQKEITATQRPKIEEPSKATPSKPIDVTNPIVNPEESDKATGSKTLDTPGLLRPVKIPSPDDLSKKRKSFPDDKAAAFNPTATAFNPGASSFVPSDAASQFTFTAAEPATPELEWPEVQRQRIMKAPPKLGVQGRQVSGPAPKSGLAAGGGLLGTSRWAKAPEDTPSPKPATAAQQKSAVAPELKSPRDSSPNRGRKALARGSSPPAPAHSGRLERERSLSPVMNETRKGFAFSTFGERLAAARKSSPPREPSPPVRGRGKKGSATTALSRSPSPTAYNNKGFDFSRYRDHHFAAPSSPPPPPKSPSLAHSPPPATPTPPPVPERSPSRRLEQTVAEPSLERMERQVSQPRPDSKLLAPRSTSAARDAHSPSPALLKPQPLNVDSRSRDGNNYMQTSPTFQEIDDVIKQLNGSDSDRYVVRTPAVQSRAGSQSHIESRSRARSQSNIGSKSRSPARLISLSPVQDVTGASPVLPTSDPNDLSKPFQYLPPEHEFGSSGSAAADLVQRNARFSPSFKPSRRDEDMSPSRRMGHIAHRESVSDWNSVLTSSDEAKFHARTRFFDSKVNDEIGEVIQAHLRPLEQVLANLNKGFEQMRNERQEVSRGPRARSADLPSDADDEDDEQPRGLSPVKDRKLEKLKSAVLEIVNQQQKSVAPEMEQMMLAFADMKTQLVQQAANAPAAKDFDTAIEESIAKHMSKINAVAAIQDAAPDDKIKVQIANLESMLKAAEQRANNEEKSRQMAEEAVQGNQKLLRIAQEEADNQRTIAEKQTLAAEETEQSLKQLLDADQESKQRMAMLEEAEEAMQSKVLNLSSKNEALEDTLEEYRMSHANMKSDIDVLRAEKDRMSDDWNKDIEAGRAENAELQRTIDNLRADAEEGLQSRRHVKEQFDRVREDMAEAAKTIARDQANWRQKEEEHNAKHELQSARLEAEARTRERLELEIERLEKQEKEAMRSRFLVEQIRSENLHLGSLINELRGKNHEFQDANAAVKRDMEDVKLRARTEIERMNKFMNQEAENARSQANVQRQEMQTIITRLEQQLDYAQQDSATAKNRFNEMIDEANDTKERALREAAENRDAALQESYRFHERQLEESRQVHHDVVTAAAEDHRRALEELQERHRREMDDLQMEHERAMRYSNSDHKRLLDGALEDKRMTENYLNGRLSLADEKVSHYTERISHLEERIEVTKAAAQAAAEAAQKVTRKETGRTPRASMVSNRPSMAFSSGNDVPDKISPQALRESIAVLQEQLHQRESKIEQLEGELEPLRDLPEKVKEKDMEITFVRELLDVRMDDLQDIIRTLSQPQGFSRERVRDAVIRLRANLQMEQQERERQIARGKDPNAAPPPQLSLAGLRDIASSPRNVGLAAAAAWGSWRRGVSQPMSNLAEMAAPGTSGDNGSTEATPSRSSPSSLLSGLLTPPTSNLRSTATSPTTTRVNSMGRRRTSAASSIRGGGRSLRSYSNSKHSQRPSLARAGQSEENRHMMLSELPQPDTPPGLLNKGSYDQDAEDGVYSLERYVNEREDDEHENEAVIEEESEEQQAQDAQDAQDYQEGPYSGGPEVETGHEAVAVVDEPFGPVIGA